VTSRIARIGLAATGTVVVIGGLIGAKTHAAMEHGEPGPRPPTTQPPTTRPPATVAPSTPGTTPSTAVPSTPTPSTTAPASTDGTYTGQPAATRYGPVQVEIDVSGGRINDIRVVQYPTADRRDQVINDYAIPILVTESLAAQSANVDAVSGATFTSEGYKQSLQSAIDKAGIG